MFSVRGWVSNVTISLLHLNEISLSFDEGSIICRVSLEHQCCGGTHNAGLDGSVHI